jgi:serine phosphatase RsbU (regulator of sigma subunit)
MKYIQIILFVCLLSPTGLSFGQDTKLDSLKAVLESLKEDTSKVNTLLDICRWEYTLAPEDALFYGNEALDLSKKLQYQRGMALANKNIGLCYYLEGDYWNTIRFWQQSLRSFEAINDKTGVSNIHNNIGAVYSNVGDHARALDYYLKSLDAAREAADSLRILTASQNIGLIYLANESSHNEAREHFREALYLSQVLEEYEAEGMVSLHLGEIWYKRGDMDSALYYFERSMAVSGMSDSNLFPLAMASSGKVYMQRKEFGKALEIQEKAYEIAKISEEQDLLTILMGLAETYVRQGDFVSSISTYKKAEQTANELEALYVLGDIYRGLSLSYAAISDYGNAYNYLFQKHEIDSSLISSSEERKTELMNFTNDILKQEKEVAIEVLEKQSLIEQLKSKRQRAIIITVVSIGIFILFLAIRFYNQTRYIKGINVKIRTQRDEIESQRDEIEAHRDEVEAQRDQLQTNRDVVVKQKNEIIESINYAKRIQSAMLPPEQYVSELLNENFIFYRPRDIVSGDFYWIKQVKQYIILLAADCTGHGVPGAFLSMLGISFLDEIVQRREITQANQILNNLRKQFKFSLRQNGQRDESKDGMDMALCILDLGNMKMQYAGANNPLYLIRDVNDNPELKEIKADRMPIGYYQGKDRSFVNHEIQLEIGDTFYIFTDGFIDQKGGKDNKKFMSKNFRNLLLDIHDQAMHDQKDILDRSLSEWMGNKSQMDDILVIGVRV